MKQRNKILRAGCVVVALVLAILGGYKLGQGQLTLTVPQVGAKNGAAQVEQVEQVEQVGQISQTIQPEQATRRILYYRNPMGLPDTSPSPKKDSMGMDYIPVYTEDEHTATDHGAHGVTLSVGKIQKLGVRTVRVTRGVIDRVVRSSGRIVADERRVHVVAPRFEGYVERLWVNAGGQAVRRGQPLFDVYAPELVSAQREYLLARQGLQAAQHGDESTQRGMQDLAQAALQRLRNWGVAQAQIHALEKSGIPQRTLSLLSPASGVVTEKKALAGQRFMPGEMLYQITDLSSVWLMADVAEQDIAQIQAGLKATINFDAWPDQSWTGRVSYIYPELNPATRSVPVRIELSNPDLQLKPDMYARVLWRTGQTPVLHVPTSAIIDSGTRQIVLVQTQTDEDVTAEGQGHFEPRVVQLGQRGETTVAVIAGLHEGERVVVAANFLIDAESNLRAALSRFEGAKAANGEPVQTPGTAATATVAQTAKTGHAEHAEHAGNTDRTPGRTSAQTKSKPAITPSVMEDHAHASH